MKILVIKSLDLVFVIEKESRNVSVAACFLVCRIYRLAQETVNGLTFGEKHLLTPLCNIWLKGYAQRGAC